MPNADSLRNHIADVLHNWWNKDYEISEAVADAILADPRLAAIIDLAAWFVDEGQPDWIPPEMSPEVRAALDDWLAERAEQEPER